jgi:protein-S-isoprenylcysteine O-methyltransferase Ste14
MSTTGFPVAHTLLVVTIAIWVVLEIRQSQKQRPEAHRADRGSLPVVRLASAVGIVGALVVRRVVPSFAIRPEGLAPWVGLAVMWSGMGLRFWSFQTLGHYFTFTVQTSPDQPVISAGPYRAIRHPSYAGILLACVGIGFVLGNWGSLAVLAAASTCGLVYRITVEERALSSDLGGRYQSYAQSRKRLVPFIW